MGKNKKAVQEATERSVDLAVAEAKIEELEQKVLELEFRCDAMGDHMRLNLMNHLLPYYLDRCAGEEKDAADLAHEMADEIVSHMEVKFEKKAAKYEAAVVNGQIADAQQEFLASVPAEDSPKN